MTQSNMTWGKKIFKNKQTIKHMISQAATILIENWQGQFLNDMQKQQQ
jgi:hypothetical protein